MKSAFFCEKFADNLGGIVLICVVCNQKNVNQLLALFKVGCPDDYGLIDAPKHR